MEKDSSGSASESTGSTPNKDASKEIKETKDKEKDKKKRVWSLFGPKKSMRKVFGTPLDELECCENTRLPIIAVHAIEYLKAHGPPPALFAPPGGPATISFLHVILSGDSDISPVISSNSQDSKRRVCSASRAPRNT
jgi:hypothetical protein